MHTLTITYFEKKPNLKDLKVEVDAVDAQAQRLVATISGGGELPAGVESQIAFGGTTAILDGKNVTLGNITWLARPPGGGLQFNAHFQDL